MINEDEPQRDAQFSAHNKPTSDRLRIRQSWWMIVLIFLLLGFTGAWIIMRFNLL